MQTAAQTRTECFHGVDYGSPADRRRILLERGSTISLIGWPDNMQVEELFGLLEFSLCSVGPCKLLQLSQPVGEELT